MGEATVSLSVVSRLRLLSRASVALVLIASVVVLVGWALDITVLASLLPGFSPMKVNAAVVSFLSAASLGLLVGEQPRGTRALLALVCAVLVTVVGLLTLCEYLFGWDLALDQVLFRDLRAAPGEPPGRMAPAAAVSFTCLGASLLLLGRGRGIVQAQGLALVALFLGLVSLVGYAFGAEPLYKIGPYVPIAVPAALQIITLSLAALCATPDAGLMAPLASNSAGGYLARRLLPLAAVPLFLGLLVFFGLRQGLYDIAVAWALAVAGSGIVLVATISGTGWNLHLVDLRRQEVERQRELLLVTLRDQEQHLLAQNEQLRIQAEEMACQGEELQSQTEELQSQAEMLQSHGSMLASREAALRRSEEQYRALFNSMTEGFALHELICDERGEPFDYRFLDVNPAFERLTGLKRETVVGRTHNEILPDDDPIWVKAFGVVALTGESAQFESPSPALGRHYEVYAYRPAPGQFAVVFRDITARKQAEDERERLLAEVQGANSLLVEANFEIENRAAESEAIFACSAEGMIIHGPAGQILQLNAAAQEMFDYLPEHLSLPPEDRQRLLQVESPDGKPTSVEENLVVRALRGETNQGVTLVVHTVAGRTVWVSTSAAPLVAGDGRRLGAVSSYADITSQHELQVERENLLAETERRAAQLAIANKELEAFSYSVSHDLRAPLRGIDGFSQALLEDYADNIDETGKGYLQLVRSESQRMAELIDAMLALSRITRAELRWERVDLSALAEKSVADLRKMEPERVVQVTIAPSLMAEGDNQLLRLVLDNLIGNAWKFTSKQAQARIEFGALEGDGEPTYFVRDNGAGFDMQYAGKLFGAFQRLHGQGEFPGHGVGLASVQRIISRHNGRIWAEGLVGQGATFYFAL